MPRVSIVMPAYNVKAHIDRAIDSALAQTEPDLELVIVDDGSTDGTGEVIARRSAQDARVRLIRHETNFGESSARNTAIGAARGDWIALLDADDWYAPTRIADLVALAEAHEADIVADNQYWILENARKPWRLLFGHAGAPPRRITLEEFVRRDMPASREAFGYLQPMIRRLFLLEANVVYDEEIRVGPDFDFLARCLFAASELILCSAPYYYYFNRAGSLSKSVSTENSIKRKAVNDQLIKLCSDPAHDKLRELLHKRSRLLDLQTNYFRVRDAIAVGNVGGAIRGAIEKPAAIPFMAKILFLGTLQEMKKRLSY